LAPGSRLIKKKRIYRAAVSQSLRNTVLEDRNTKQKEMLQFSIVLTHFTKLTKHMKFDKDL